MSESYPKLNDRQRRFAEYVVAGDPATIAYGKAGYSTKGRNAEGNASALMENHGVKAYMEELRAESSKVSALTKADMIRKLCDIIESPPSAASMDNPLCELRMSKAGPFAVFPDKGRAIERLSKLCGWDAPDKHEVDSTIKIIIGGNAEA